MKKILLFMILFCIQNKLISQLDTTFWFVAPEVAQNHGDRPIVFRFATLSSPATITISQPSNSLFPIQQINLAANSAQTFDLTPFIDIVENKPANTILNYGFKISATAQITAYYEVTPTCNCNPDIFALKGQNALGNAFLTPFQNFLNNASYARSGFNIIATEDNTSVTIIPSRNIVGHSAGIPFTITLNRGQTYCAEASSTSSSQHLDGSSVVANKKIAITLHDDTAEGTPYGGCADLQGDQLIPISILGMEYIAIKGYLNGPDKVYILSTSNGNQINIDGINVGNINTGQTYVHTLSNSTAYIVATDSIYVLHQSGFGCEVGEAILPPLICTGSSVVPFTRSTNEFFAVNILVPSGFENNFTYNGAAGIINGANFNFVPGTNNNWKYAQLDMSSIVPIQLASRIENLSTKFHMGLIHGGSSSGCRYGYFSDFSALKYQINATNSFICQGEPINLNSNILPGATYTWTGPNNFSQTGASILIPNAQPSNSGIYIVSGQLPDACQLLPDTIDITVNPTPPTPLIFNDGPWCENETILFWNENSNNYNLQWTDNSGNILSSNDTLIINSVNSIGTISVNLIVSENNCFSEPQSQSNSILTSPIITATNINDVCGNSINLSSQVIPNPIDPIDSIFWNRLNGLSFIGLGQNYNNVNSSLPPSSQESFIVTALSENGCVGKDTIIVSFHSIPDINLTYEDLCNGEDILFNIQQNWLGIPQPGESMNGVINFGDGTSAVNTSSSIQHNYNTTEDYNVSCYYESNYGCKDSTSILISFKDDPSAIISIKPLCDQRAELSASLALGNFNLQNLNWNIQGVSISNQQNFTYDFPSGGEYDIELVLNNQQCTYDFRKEFYVESIIELDDIEVPNIITINGDGINDKIEFNSIFEKCKDYELFIFNRWGTNVFTTISSEKRFEGKDNSDIELVPGTYYYIIKSNKIEKKGFITVIK